MLKHLLQFLLKIMARAVLARHRPRVVGITGSVGKTTTKEAIFAVLQPHFSVARSLGNFNNELGLPLAVLQVRADLAGVKLCLAACACFFLSLFRSRYPKVLVLEMGADRVGDIKYLVAIAKPEIGVVTRVGEAHTEFFGDLEAVQREKSQLISSLPKLGLAVLNADDARVAAMGRLHAGPVMTFGLSESADVRAENIGITQRTFGPELAAEKALGIKFTLRFALKIYPVEVTALLGLPGVYSLLAAFAVAVGMGLEPDRAAAALAQVPPTAGRLRPLSGIKNTILLDDSYNSSPEAVMEALKILKQVRARRRLVVLGDMLELGAQTESSHRRVGRVLQTFGVDMLFSVGPWARFIADEARHCGFPKSRIFEFDTSEAAGRSLQEKLLEGDVVLIKGSQQVRMEGIVLEVMANPGDAKNLLCRQDRRWQKH